MAFTLPEEFGVLPTEAYAELTGLQQLQKMIAGEFPPPPIARTLNYIMTEADEGRVVFRGQATDDFFNPLGTTHGGWIATLLDSALGCAVHATLAPREGYTTLEFKVNCVRAVNPGRGEMVCEGRIVHRGRTTATSEATLKDLDGKLYAHATETCMIFPAKG